MGIESQRPVKNRVIELQQKRVRQLTVKIKPVALRPNLLSEVPQVNTIGVGQGGRRVVRLAGGDLPVTNTSESEWYYPSAKFSENASQAGLAGDDASAVKNAVAGREDDRCGF